MRICPFCSEVLPDEAVVCTRCGRDLSPQVQAGQPAAAPSRRASTQFVLFTLFGCVVIFFVTVGAWFVLQDPAIPSQAMAAVRSAVLPTPAGDAATDETQAPPRFSGLPSQYVPTTSWNMPWGFRRDESRSFELENGLGYSVTWLPSNLTPNALSQVTYTAFLGNTVADAADVFVGARQNVGNVITLGYVWEPALDSRFDDSGRYTEIYANNSQAMLGTVVRKSNLVVAVEVRAYTETGADLVALLEPELERFAERAFSRIR